MRLAISSMLSLAAFWSNSVLAQGYSDEYNKCLNTSYGEIETVKKCVDKELKNQGKILNKVDNLKMYIKCGFVTILTLYTTNFIGPLSYQAFSFLKLLALS